MRHCSVTCLCHFSNKSECCQGWEQYWPHDYIASVINPYTTGGMTVMSPFATLPKLDKSGHGLCMSHRVKSKISHICNGKSHYTKNYQVNSESGVNFQVPLKQNYTKMNHIQKDVPVFFVISLDPSGHVQQ